MRVEISSVLTSALLTAALTACSGGGGDTANSQPSTGTTTSPSPAPTPTPTPTPSPSPSASTPAQLVAKLGKPSRLLVGTGGGAEVTNILSQAIRPDIYDRYLVGVGDRAWPTWNAPSGAYVGVVAAAAESVGAVPMYTLYQMATNGDGNLSGLTDSAFMTGYWANVRLMFQQIAIYDKPALVNLEPDFWGYVQRLAMNGDPTKMAAKVTIDNDCAGLTNDVVGVAACMVKMARKYAPKAYIGFPPSDWGADSTAQLTAFMNKIGAANADFIVMQTSDRDAGCFEMTPQPDDCVRTGAPWYWDESNQTHPNFHDHFSYVQTYRAAVGNLPVLWWQTPFGVTSAIPGGGTNHYRDNRVHYFLTHPSEITAVGGFAVVFGAGADTQTDITSDGLQFQTLSNAYLANPTPLP